MTVNGNDRIFTKDFLLTTAISFSCLMTEFLLTVSIASYAMKEFGVSVSEAGLASGIFVFGGLLSRMFFGRYIEYVGRKRMLFIALILTAGAAALYFISMTFPMLCVTRFLHGASLAICSACTSDIATKMIPEKRRAEGLGYFLLGLTLALAVGPYVGLLFIGNDQYNIIFSLCIALYAVSMLILLLISVPEEDLTEEQKEEFRHFNVKDLLERNAIPLSIVVMILMLSFSGVMSFIASYSNTMGFGDAAPAFYLSYSVMTLISRFTVGRIVDNRGANILLIPAFVSFMIGMVVYSFADSIFSIVVAGILMGFAVSAIFPSVQSLILKGTESRRYGSSISTYLAIVDLGSGFGPLIIGVIIDMLGYRHSYLLCAGIAAVSMLMYWIIYGSKQKILRCDTE